MSASRSPSPLGISICEDVLGGATNRTFRHAAYLSHVQKTDVCCTPRSTRASGYWGSRRRRHRFHSRLISSPQEDSMTRRLYPALATFLFATVFAIAEADWTIQVNIAYTGSRDARAKENR